ncbi:hypothetical protein IEQ34_007377 [Dendrobium chrysotoxum]|uniref:Uncharacterized protein n=1 Tax=Dendrobium chrysotoxum TaxID=161865 RepID=A0AAV7H6R8_DENCH|nr:hypothetical protein IEQ34_007377 [Dendrobium chrysotoxum]
MKPKLALRCDNATSNGSLPSVARVLVELDILKQYLDCVTIGLEKIGYIQKVIMDDFLSFCDHCKSLGHFRKECASLHPHLAKEPINSLKPISAVDVKTAPTPLVAPNPVGENVMDVIRVGSPLIQSSFIVPENVDKATISFPMGEIVIDDGNTRVGNSAIVHDNVHTL